MPDDSDGVDRRARQARTRRAFLLLGLTVVLPGSAQLVHGRRGLGLLGLRVWLTLVLLVVLTALAWWLFPDQLVALVASRTVLWVLAVLVAVVGLIGLILLLNTWTMARPLTLGWLRGGCLTGLTAILATVLVLGGVTAGRYLLAAGQVVEQVLGGGGDRQAKEGRYNILLLGADSGADREGLRPDSITLASVDADSGRTVLFGLPRNLEGAQFAPGSPLAGLYPDGYWTCGEENCLLNSVYLLGQEHADLYPGVADPGVQAMIDAVSGTLGLEINYYAMVNMAGFASLIDAVGGIDLTVNQPTTIGVLDDWMQAWGVVELEPGRHHFDGQTALLFARSRVDGSDYDRMARQKCVMAAMLNQLQPSVVAQNFVALADASGNLLVTSVPSAEIAELGRLALKARQLPITSIAFTPPLIHTGSPDYNLIRQVVRDAIAAAEAADQAVADPSPTDVVPPDDPDVVDPTDPNQTPTEDANTVEDLAVVCSV
ncbi:MAG: LCP family protein [Propionibacteriaceae bacterium]|nr:LCP family protein [Propionibacteriaceae bacterium]